nr:MAG TPA: hypothetical protein [Caudoviricetes sp.]
MSVGRNTLMPFNSGMLVRDFAICCSFLPLLYGAKVRACRRFGRLHQPQNDIFHAGNGGRISHGASGRNGFCVDGGGQVCNLLRHCRHRVRGHRLLCCRSGSGGRALCRGRDRLALLRAFQRKHLLHLLCRESHFAQIQNIVDSHVYHPFHRLEPVLTSTCVKVL